MTASFTIGEVHIGDGFSQDQRDGFGDYLSHALAVQFPDVEFNYRPNQLEDSHTDLDEATLEEIQTWRNANWVDILEESLEDDMSDEERELAEHRQQCSIEAAKKIEELQIALEQLPQEYLPAFRDWLNRIHIPPPFNSGLDPRTWLEHRRWELCSKALSLGVDVTAYVAVTEAGEGPEFELMLPAVASILRGWLMEDLNQLHLDMMNIGHENPDFDGHDLIRNAQITERLAQTIDRHQAQVIAWGAIALQERPDGYQRKVFEIDTARKPVPEGQLLSTFEVWGLPGHLPGKD